MVHEAVWQSIKKFSSYRRHGASVALDTDPYNFTGKTNLVNSGLVNSTALVVSLDKKNNIVLLRKKASKGKRSIQKAFEVINLTSDRRKAISAIRGISLKGLKYRPELARAAVKKYFKLNEAQKRAAAAAKAKTKTSIA